MNQLENRQPLVQVAVWTLGEYGEAGHFDENELIEHYRQLLWAPQLSITTKQYILVSLAKISVRMEHCTANIQNIINSFRVHLNIDLQQRAVEFNQLFTSHQHLRAAILEKMPTLKITDISTSEYNSDFALTTTTATSSSSPSSGESSAETSPGQGTSPSKEPSNQDILLDLLGDSFVSSSSTSETAATPSPLQQSTPLEIGTPSNVLSPNRDILDLLGLSNNNNQDSGLFVNPSSSDAVFNGLNNNYVQPSVPVGSQEYSATTISVYSRDNIDIRFILKREQDHAVVTVKTTNNSLNMLEKYMFQVAVPKSFTIQMLEPSSTVMLPGESVVQDINVYRTAGQPPGASLRMKVRFSYENGNYSMMEQAEVNDFPPDLFL
ncbi:AP-1 complex subunit gamma-1-like [Uranotaenia lowii]|uniref:AP-1 complex subunit gamma-1-like n=1 Tax=Uranotaenia lowii TaxID=190385 RepID=UPI0024793F15|nr:AP-1 complex subunit gamma-1-like [Uranotaenia lowii]